MFNRIIEIRRRLDSLGDLVVSGRVVSPLIDQDKDPVEIDTGDFQRLLELPQEVQDAYAKADALMLQALANATGKPVRAFGDETPITPIAPVAS